MTCALCVAASSMWARCRFTIESLSPVHAVWTSAAFTFVIRCVPPSRLRTLMQLLGEADQLLRRERAPELVLHPVRDPRDGLRLAWRERVEDRARDTADPHRGAGGRGQDRPVFRIWILDDDRDAAVGQPIEVTETVAHAHGRQSGRAGELEPRFERRDGPR